MQEDLTEASGESIRTFMRILRRRWWIIIACLIVVPAAAFAYTRLQPKKYSATANILVNSASSSSSAGTANTASAEASILNTATSLATLPIVPRRTALALGPPYATTGMPGDVTVDNLGSSDILTVMASERNASLAALVANTYARQFIAFSTRSNLATLRKQEADLRRQIKRLGKSSENASTVNALTGQLSQLTALSSVQNSSLQLVAPATPPSSPSSPKTGETVGAGAVLGLLLGILLALLFAVLDRRLREPDAVQSALEGPILGAIPRTRALARAWGKDGDGPSGASLEAFSMILTSMTGYNTGAPVRSVLISSANSGEGKSTVAWNLALTAARSGAAVLLIEADLRRPAIASRIGADVELGLVDVLGRRGVALGEAIRSIPLSSRPGAVLGPATVQFDNGNGGGHLGEVNPYAEAEAGRHPDRHRLRWRGRQGVAGLRQTVGENPAEETQDEDRAHLEILFAGHRSSSRGLLQRSPSAMLASKQMRDLIKTAERAYDLVVIDSPPTTAVSDAIPLVSQVSGVLIVSRVSRNTRDTAVALRRQLAHLRARVLGVVVNGVEPIDGYGSSVGDYLLDAGGSPARN